MGSKTYVSASLTNLNSSNEEFRWERLAMLESSVAHWQHIQYGIKLSDNQRAGHGTAFRNWIYWARQYKLSGYTNDEILKNCDFTYNDLYSFFEPIVSSPVELDEDQMNSFVENTLKLPSGTEESDSMTVTVVGQLPDGSFQEVTLTGARARVQHKSKVLGTYSGSYDSEQLGHAYVWQQYDTYLKDSDYIKRMILSDGEQQGYRIIGGNSFATDEGNVEGDYNDCWLQIGYTFEEPHTDPETNEEVIQEIFNSEEDTYIPLKSSIPNYSSYFAMYGYVYDVCELDSNQYQFNGDYLALDSSGNPKKLELIPDAEGNLPEPNWKQIKSKLEIEIETYNSTMSESYESDINLGSVQGFGYIVDLKSVASDPVLGGVVNTDLEQINSLMPPIVPFMNDKQWLHENFQPQWNANVKACKKVTGDSEYYPELHKTLKEQITQEEIAWVFLIYGLPINYTQTHMGAHYALQFFKQLTIPNWADFKHGDIGSAYGNGLSFKFGIRGFNCQYKVEIQGGTYYECGKGLCPAPGYSDIRPGEAGVCNYNGRDTFWVQHQSDSWEYISITKYYGHFPDVKNGVGGHLTGNSFYTPLWRTVDVERQYSKVIIPFMWTIGKNIPYTDWTDLYQYSQNVAATAYKVVKTKWYQTTLFKVILIIIIIVITVIVSYFCPPAGAAVSKAGASIATAVGVGSTAFWTAVVAVAVSIAVSVVVNAIITPMLQKAFGNTIGAILGAIISIIASAYINGGASITDALDELLSPMTWVQIGQAALKGMQQDIAEKMQQLRQEMTDFSNRLTDAQDELNAAKAEAGIIEQNKFQKEMLRKYGARNPNALDECTIETAENFINRCLTNVINCIPNAFSTLENYTDIAIDSKTVPSIMFEGSNPSQSLV